MIVKVALAPANTDWELKLVLGLMTGREAMAAQGSRIAASMAASRHGSLSGLLRRRSVTLGGD